VLPAVTKKFIGVRGAGAWVGDTVRVADFGHRFPGRCPGDLRRGAHRTLTF
jgi:hypothetical protein